MKKFISALCTVSLFFGLVVMLQAQQHDPTDFFKILPGECCLDGLMSPPHKSIDDMGGFEVPLVATWSTVEPYEGIRYRGGAKFRVYNFRIGEGDLVDSYIVDIDLIRDDPNLSEIARHKRFVYKCAGTSGNCIATLVSAKETITQQIARDYKTGVENVIYENDASANFLGVFVNGMNQIGMKTEGNRGHIYIHTEVCGAYEIILAEASRIN